MKNSKVVVRLFTAAFAAAALSVMASAEDRAPDFDRTGVDVPKLVSETKDRAKKEGGPAVESRRAPDAKAAAEEDDIERRIVVFEAGVGAVSRMAAVRTLGAEPVKDLRIINAVAVVVPKSRAKSLDAGLKARRGVKRVERDFVQNWLRSDEPTTPPAAKEQTTPWGIDRVNARKAWNVTRGAGAKIAVVDTGVDMDHPDLKLAGGYNCIDPNVSYKDDNGHGTHVAGTIAAQDNKEGVVGIAPDVQLYGVKVLDSWGSGTFADVITGIQWAAENKMDVANFSLGAGAGTEALAEAVKAAAAAGLTIMAAAGNSGESVGFPAAYPETIAVAASDSGDKVADFSSRGPEVDFIAPGVGVESTYMGGGYDTLDGTSMATPHMTGLAALAAAQGIRGPEAIRAALLKAAKKIPDVPAEQQGAGMVDAGLLVGAKTAPK